MEGNVDCISFLFQIYLFFQSKFPYHILRPLNSFAGCGADADWVRGQTCASESDLSVSHAGRRYQSLLQSFVLQSTVLLLPLTTPFQLQQVLDNLWVSSESSVDQCTLPTLIYMINLAGEYDMVSFTRDELTQYLSVDVHVWGSSPCPPSCRATWLFPGGLLRPRSRGGSCRFRTPRPRWPQTPAAGRQSPGARGGTGRRAPARCSGPPCGNSRLHRRASADGSPDCTNEMQTQTDGVGTTSSKR